MPTLHWIGKEKVMNHHRDVPFRVLEHEYGFTNGHIGSTETDSGNKIIHGDNLEALKALLPEYEGKVKCIYIDPPYNTGKDEWKYSDKVDHPQIKKWLDQVVGKEGEDLSRHDKWLCMMYPRLVLLKRMLMPEGVIFISIDNNEVFNLKLILDEIFGPMNFIGNIIWETATDNNPTQISTEHEYVLCYAANNSLQGHWYAKSLAAESIQSKYEELKKKFTNDIDSIQKDLRKWIKANKDLLPQVTHYDNVDKKGVFHDADVANTKFGGYNYEVIHPVTGMPCKIPEKGFRFPETTMKELIENDDIMFGSDETTLIKPKKRLDTVKDRLRSVIYEDGRASTKELEQMFHKDFFKNPKSETIVRRLLSFCTSDSDIVLDSFAGSGTTAHAVLNLNKQDSGNRKFILIEMEDYAETTTAERVKRVVTGYNHTEGADGAFDYYSLGEPLFIGANNECLNSALGKEKVRQYVWYSETRTVFPTDTEAYTEQYFLGKKEETAYYFIYETDSLTTLDFEMLSTIKVKAGQYVIYADNCLLPTDFMLKKNIVFKKIPRDITRF
ncbi:MAG: site-specific DNA-methyltransferase [Bacteroidota bacterium]